MSVQAEGRDFGIAAACMALLPAAAAASSVAAAAWVALCLLIFSTVLRMLAPFFRKTAGERASSFLLAFILATLASVAVSVVSLVDPAPALALGIYLPLAAASSSWTGEASALSRGEEPRSHASALLAAAIVLLCGLVREAVGASRISLPLGIFVAKTGLPGSLSMGPMENPVGSLFTLAFVASLAQWIAQKRRMEAE